MKTKEVLGVKFKVDKAWEKARDKKTDNTLPVKKKGFLRKLIDFVF